MFTQTPHCGRWSREERNDGHSAAGEGSARPEVGTGADPGTGAGKNNLALLTPSCPATTDKTHVGGTCLWDGLGAWQEAAALT
ncbi:hypothetical protein AB0D57_18575 [Streptomyces sp. NPDC048275]|uniref:hypothetical protein n=1 Tax=Streptomyces sp. NPDC048275 TaxID=3155629 RepID=UPI0033C736B8